MLGGFVLVEVSLYLNHVGDLNIILCCFVNPYIVYDLICICRKTQSVPPPEKTQGWISLSFMCNCFVFGLISYKCIRVNIRAI